MLRRRAAAALGVVVAGVAVAACAAPVDRVGEAEDGIADLLAGRLHDDPDDIVVACPDDTELLPGSDLTCSVAVGGADAIDVSFVLGAAEGDPARLTRAVIPTDDAERYLAGELASPAEGAVRAECGDAPFLVRDVGATFECDVLRAADGVTFRVVVTVLSVDGAVRHQVQPTTTTLSTTTIPGGAP